MVIRDHVIVSHQSPVTCQILHGDITVQPGLLAAADALGLSHSGLRDCEALVTTVTALSLSLSS